ncbi:MAG: ornithine cyclodeaminase family protein [Anaerolineae bacterium]
MRSKSLRILNGDDVRQAVSMVEAITAMKGAFAQLSAGKVTVPLRSSVETDEGIILFMPAYLKESGDLGAKVVSVYEGNPALGLPTIMALVLVIDAQTGKPLAVMDGTYLTALRTGAASGLATELLARKEAQVVGLFGAGVQAKTQLEAVCQVRDIAVVRVLSRTSASAQRFAAEMRGRGKVPQRTEAVSTPKEVVQGADIVITATTSPTPVFDGRDIGPGTHINAIGAFTPQTREVDDIIVRRAKIVVDSREACLAEAGDLLIPMDKGIISREDIHAELGEVVSGTRAGRENDDEVTFFKSVGVAVQDVAVGRRILEEAIKKDLGTVVEI